jgi:hypothetical protein
MHDNTFIGLDVQKATISVAVAQDDRGGEVRHWGTVVFGHWLTTVRFQHPAQRILLQNYRHGFGR